MPARNISITFHTNVSANRPWFQVPRAIARTLGVKSGDSIGVAISKPDGEPVYQGLGKLDALPEVYSAHIGRPLTKGEEIRITISRAPYLDLVNRPEHRIGGQHKRSGLR